MWIAVVASALFLLHLVRRGLVCDSFIIRGSSMEPTLTDGQKVYVRKYLMGPRVYTDYSFEEGEPLKCFRLPGFRGLQVGDVAVFNSPEGLGGGKIGFRLNYVYAKRCMGVSGDTVRIVDSHYLSSGMMGQVIPEDCENVMRTYPDSMLIQNNSFPTGYFTGEEKSWTMKDFGPVVVPKKGMTILLDSLNLVRYAWVIEFETGQRPKWEGCPKGTYTFKEDYTFFVGDNAVNSRDSRYFGFVPEKYVIGIIKE